MMRKIMDLSPDTTVDDVEELASILTLPVALKFRNRLELYVEELREVCA